LCAEDGQGSWGLLVITSPPALPLLKTALELTHYT
jgi:hypothetical protein